MTVWVDFVITTMILEMQKFFKEKATNTQELLRQHAQLQGDADKKDEELSQLRMARQGLQSQLEAIQATSEAAASTPLPRYAFCGHLGFSLMLKSAIICLAGRQQEPLMLWIISPMP